MTEDFSDEIDQEMRVRPYALTGGRTRSKVELSIETLVRTSMYGYEHFLELSTDDQRILELAEEPISVAEISAHTHVVLGVARVLTGDLVSAGHLDQSGPTPAPTGAANVSLLERVLDGLKSL